MNTPTLTIKLDYTDLWEPLIDERCNKEYRKRKTGVSAASIARINEGKSVIIDILLQICQYLGCDIADICKIVPNEPEEETT